jgi:regulator of replication initiation timing
MEKRTERNRNGASRSSSDPDLVARLYERIARLHAVIRELRSTSEDLEADRERLLEENRALRRKVTLSTLVEDLEATITNEMSDADAIEPSAPTPADRLYHQLPRRFTFSHFFRTAGDENIETETARRCLIHYLTEEMLVQSGAHLEKTAP